MDLLKGLGLGLAFGFIIWNMIRNKKASIVSFILFLLVAVIFCIQSIDKSYYESKFGSISYFDVYLLVVTYIMVALSILELVLGSRNKKEPKVEETLQENEPKEATSIEETQENQYFYAMLPEPLAYFDEKKQGYVLNQAMKKELQVSTDLLTTATLKEKMNEEDQPTYMVNQKATSGEVYYRLKTASGESWFEELHAVYQHQLCIVLRKNIGMNVNIGSFKELNQQLENWIEQKKDFYFIVLNLVSIEKITSTQGKDFADICTAKYFAKIFNGPLKDGLSIYRLGNTEYALLIEESEYYDLILRQLANKSCELVYQEFFINKIRMTIHGKMGMVSSKDVSSLSPRSIANAAFDMVQQASSLNYEEDYCIYQGLDLSNESCSLEDLNLHPDTDLDLFKKDFLEE